MGKVTFTNVTTSYVQICNPAGICLKQISSERGNNTFSIPTKEHGVQLYIKRTDNSKVTDQFTYKNGQVLINNWGTVSKKLPTTVTMTPFRESYWSLKTVQKVAKSVAPILAPLIKK